ncbi:MAG: NAD(P)H-hydrate dehydratase [Candidatus Paceibacterota bacterium]
MDQGKWYPKRGITSKKGDFGKVLVISGSRKYTGSPIFNAVSALRAGADLTYIITHPRAAQVAASFAPDIITIPLADELSFSDVKKIAEESRNFDSLVIGGGLCRDLETFKVIRDLISEIEIPMVIDAEAIRALAEDKNIFSKKKAILTPHAEEFRVLSGEEISDDMENKVKRQAAELNSVILLKGHNDIISDGKEVLMNETGDPFMTKGGFGDTLAGITGALLARDPERLLEAAHLAAYINGRAGEMASEIYREGLLASDIFDLIPSVINNELGSF